MASWICIFQRGAILVLMRIIPPSLDCGARCARALRMAIIPPAWLVVSGVLSSYNGQPSQELIR